jgi:dTDP-4-amino-4,6-dideoxygalactose transaminase
MIPISKPILGEEEKKAVLKILDSGNLAQGVKVEEFERKFAKYIGTRYAIATSSGTSALHIALLANDVGPGDEVITTPFTFIASSNAILYCGARPVFVDIGEDFDINPDLIEKKITKKIKAILPVHLFGYPADMDKIMKIAKRYHLVVIEDACQAHGASIQRKKVGSFGTGCFSFYPTKNMTTGEGGVITTNDKKVAERAKLLRNHGMKQKYRHEIIGFNFRMTDIAATIGLEQLKKIEKFNKKRIANADYFNKNIKTKKVILPVCKENYRHVYHQYVIRITDNDPRLRDKVIKILRKEGIESVIHYPLPIYRQKPYLKLGYKEHLPNTERFSKEVLSLPVHPALSKKELNQIISVLNRL